MLCVRPTLGRHQSALVALRRNVHSQEVKLQGGKANGAGLDLRIEADQSGKLAFLLKTTLNVGIRQAKKIISEGHVTVEHPKKPYKVL